jgi:hypothetical protein
MLMGIESQPIIACTERRTSINWSSPKRFKARSAHSRTPMASKIGLNNRPINFLFVGMIYPRKGIAARLEAFERIPASEAKLTLVGEFLVPETTFGRFTPRVT